MAQFVIISIGTSIVKELATIFCLQISKIALSYFTQTARLGIALVLNELIFWKYLKQVLFRRILCINNDFIGIWLEITNLVIAAYLTMVQAHGTEFQAEVDPNIVIHFYFPGISIKMNIILYGLILLQLLFASIHYLLKKPMKNQVMHINIQPSEPIQVEFLPMNNLQFNPELLNLKIIGVILTTILTIWFLFGLRIYRWGNKTAELIALVFGYNSSMPILEFADMLRPTLLAFLQLVIACAYFGNSKKMQRFTQNLLKCRWEEL